MSGSPDTPSYPDRPLHPIVGSGCFPHNPYPNFPPNTYHPPPNLYYPPNTCDPEDYIPHPPGFILTDRVLPSYPSQESNEKTPVKPSPAFPPVSNMGNYRWVGASSSSCSMPGALLVGHDSDGSEIYAGRAYHMGDMIPAKVIPSKQVAYIAYGGEEIVKDQFEVLCPPAVHWIPSSGGNVPPNAVSVGTTGDGEPLFLGRVYSNGALTPGKIQPSHGCCYYPFDGQEVSAVEYECLVIQ